MTNHSPYLFFKSSVRGSPGKVGGWPTPSGVLERQIIPRTAFGKDFKR